MKLRALIERGKAFDGKRMIKLTFPKGVNPVVQESILQRNLGPRPYAEGFWVNDKGEQINTVWATSW